MNISNAFIIPIIAILSSASALVLFFAFSDRIYRGIDLLKQSFVSLRNSAIVRQIEHTDPYSFWPKLEYNYNKSFQSTIQFYLCWADMTKTSVARQIAGICAISIFLAAISSLVLAVVFCVLAISAVVFWVLLQFSNRRKKFVEQLPSTIDALVDAQRAGLSLIPALSMIGRSIEMPLQGVFDAIIRGEKYQMTLRQTIDTIHPQLQLDDWTIFAECLCLQETIGGNVLPIMHDLSETLREKARINKEVDSLTTIGKMSGGVICIMTPSLLVFMSLLMPKYMYPLFHTDTGVTVLFVATALTVTATYIIMRIVKVEY